MQTENSASDRVYNYVMEKIVSNVWKPKARIMSENKLATELNVSRIAVREALEKLSALGLLDKKQGYGTVVKEINPSILLNNLVPIIALNENGIKDIIEFRIHFEVGNVEMFMRNYDQAVVDQLRDYYEQMCSNYDNPEQYNLYDFHFHKAIAIGTKNPIVIGISDILHSILKHNIDRLYDNVGPDVAMYYHKVILEAIVKKDSELACLLMRRHLEDALEKVSEQEG